MRRLMQLAMYTLLVVIVTLVALAAAGQLNSVQVTTRTIARPVTPAPSAIKCPSRDITMQCVLRNQDAPHATAPPKSQPNSPASSSSSTTSSLSTTSKAARGAVTSGLQAGGFTSSLAVTPSRYGIDFGWSTISASGAKAIGAKFGASYFSSDASKNWTRAAVVSYHRLGLATVGVWETSANRTQAGYSAGVSDAIAARGQAAAVGNTTRPIDFAVDCDCAVSSIVPYFRGVYHVLGSRTGAYGGYYQIRGLYLAHVVGHENWQTYAWSSGLWLPASIAPLEQYLNGNAFDNDRALAAAYGQWPGPSLIKPNPYAIYPTTRYRFGRVRASERNSVRTWDRNRCKSPARRKVCRSSASHLLLLERRLYYVAHHPLRHHKPTWGVAHRGARYRGISRRLAAR